MDRARLADRIHWGMNAAARATGAMTSAYRPQGPGPPLADRNRFLKLHATFSGIDGKFSRPNGYGNALWNGIFDAAYTRPGDYLVQHEGTWFVAAQSPLLPVLCVKTNRTISFTRATTQTTTGIGGYGGITASNVAPIMTSWPASVLVASREGRPFADLPGDTAVSYWMVLVPTCPGVILRIGDLLSDDLGRNGVVTTTELSEFGWRLAVRQATT